MENFPKGDVENPLQKDDSEFSEWPKNNGSGLNQYDEYFVGMRHKETLFPHGPVLIVGHNERQAAMYVNG